MIPLVVPAEIRGADGPFVVRLSPDAVDAHDAQLRRTDENTILVTHGRARARLAGSDPGQFAGDVVLLDPDRSIMHRLIRAGSRHNTFLVTERCDQPLRHVLAAAKEWPDPIGWSGFSLNA